VSKYRLWYFHPERGGRPAKVFEADNNDEAITIAEQHLNIDVPQQDNAPHGLYERAMMDGASSSEKPVMYWIHGERISTPEEFTKRLYGKS
jgi:hypothetical protein